MTYGWAILIVIIVAAALYALGVFTPSSSETEARFATLGTSPAHMVSVNQVEIKLPNQVGKTITVTNVTVEPTAGGAGCTTNATMLPFTIGAGQIADNVSITGCPASLGLAVGNSYSLKVTVDYTPQGGYAKTDTATVTGTVA